MPAPATTLDPALLDRAASVIKCLGHPLRQLATLRRHGVVTARRDGPFVRYSIAEPKVLHILACIRGCGA